MTFQSDLKAYLLGDNALAALVDTRIYHDAHPQSATLPFVVYYDANAKYHQSLSCAIKVTKPGLTFTVYSASYGSGVEIVNAIKNALLAGGYLVEFKDERSDRDMTTAIHHRDLDVKISYAT